MAARFANADDVAAGTCIAPAGPLFYHRPGSGYELRESGLIQQAATNGTVENVSMYLETSDGARARVDKSRLARLLERPAPLIALRGPGTALVALQDRGQCYRLLYWNGRTWQESTTTIPAADLTARFLDFLGRGRAWRDDTGWKAIRPVPPGRFAPLFPAGLHILLSFVVVFGGFGAGILLACRAGDLTESTGRTVVYVWAVVLAPTLAVLGQYVARQIPAACDQCGEPVINLQTGRFAYLCTECGRLNITRWGIHRGPMAP